jgi:hypothetical protein
MNVGDLINELEKMDKNMPVVAYDGLNKRFIGGVMPRVVQLGIDVGNYGQPRFLLNPSLDESVPIINALAIMHYA